MDPLQLLVNGIALGSIIALAAVGLTLTFGILRLPNFAHGDFMTLGAYATLLANVNFGWNIWLSTIFGAIATVAAMLLAERTLWQPMRQVRAQPTTLIVISIGLALFIRSAILMVWGGTNLSYDLPVVPAIALPPDDPIVRIAFNRIVVVILSIVAIVALHFFLQRSKVGKAMRAVADNIDLARVAGINVERVVLWTWAIAGVLTAAGGATYGLIAAVRPNMGWFLILPMFAATILGGIGNPYGAIAGAYTIGIAQELSVPLLGSQYKLGVALFLMTIVLLVRPQGLFKGTL
ncbi:branched-chain amino acid ABC-type transport system, permease component [Rubidibacter lacunae KORDI 51-2]|uniref:Branched-chain amino acid ABC-type transport system, permease component n=1 Tax=Rubidibacter lacunae KORDI 51-2 TaxID=582515 RepID=U5DF31_9CHRO|nr:branched-chain amino acid ABC transporter permease [Rubidibacter lacunae]ERN40216.1 branched-chain amino acid ABC-type transport system, permease component [Rubidibacter lacunae KORDI 51-2]